MCIAIQSQREFLQSFSILISVIYLDTIIFYKMEAILSTTISIVTIDNSDTITTTPYYEHHNHDHAALLRQKVVSDIRENFRREHFLFNFMPYTCDK